MSLRVAVQMDPMETIKIAGDSSFALMLEAEARGHSVWHTVWDPRPTVATQVGPLAFAATPLAHETGVFVVGLDDVADRDPH